MSIATQAKGLAVMLGMEGNEQELVATLKATAFKGNVSDAQMTALLIVAGQYQLNPFTKEIFAFPSQGAIVPVVSVDGWTRIINSNPMFDGMDFEQDAESCTCKIYRKDRSHPISVTEYMSECRKSNSPAWSSHPKRMLRHKALIQCARIAFSLSGIYDPDEADRIVEAESKKEPIDMGAAEVVNIVMPGYDDDKFAEMLPKWGALIFAGQKTADEIILTLESKVTLSEDQKNEIKKLGEQK